VLVEERDPREDRQGIREERRRAGGRERAAALEPELERHERETVRGEHRDQKERPGAAERPGLRRDVTGGVEQAGGDAE